MKDINKDNFCQTFPINEQVIFTRINFVMKLAKSRVIFQFTHSVKTSAKV